MRQHTFDVYRRTTKIGMYQQYDEVAKKQNRIYVFDFKIFSVNSSFHSGYEMVVMRIVYLKYYLIYPKDFQICTYSRSYVLLLTEACFCN